MGGGLLQLIAVNDEDQYLIKNPNINFFKKVYMRHSNFTASSFEIPCTTYNKMGENTIDNKLSFNNSTKYMIRIPRNGDLVTNIFFKCNLPKIYSENIAGKGFKYVENIGFSMIKSAAIFIENTLVERVTGEYLYIYHKLHNKKLKNNIIDSMVHTSAINKDDIYNESSLEEENFITSGGDKYINKNYNRSASIQDKNIIVPLTFWFEREYGLSIPLIALKYHQVYLELELRPLKDLFILNTLETNIKSNDDVQPFSNLYYSKPTINNINDFIKSDWNFNPILDINYIFLDNRERNYITANTQDYLIEQVQKTDILNISGSNTINLRLYHPTKEIIIVPKRTDISNRNQWLNFSNHDSENLNYEDYQQYKIDNDDKANYSKTTLKKILNIWKYRKYREIPTIDHINNAYFTRNIINSMSIDLDNTERLELKNESFFSKKQLLNHYNGSNINDILVFPFSLEPSKYKPSGSCNLSEIDNITFNINLKKPNLYENNIFSPYKYNISIYTVNYNILSIQHGMGGLVYANK